jgi:hypothetical protein
MTYEQRLSAASAAPQGRRVRLPKCGDPQLQAYLQLQLQLQVPSAPSWHLVPPPPPRSFFWSRWLRPPAATSETRGHEAPCANRRLALQNQPPNGAGRLLLFQLLPFVVLESASLTLATGQAHATLAHAIRLELLEVKLYSCTCSKE